MFTGRSRWTPLLVSLSVAAVFIALRIVYRLLFGSFSLAAVGQAALLAMPFAVLIVAFGLVSSLIDFRTVLVRLSLLRYTRSVGTALSIALASFPTLLMQIRRMNRYRQLRGIRSRFATLVPVLEHTVEKSVALAAALELRGFGQAPSTHQIPTPHISFDSYSLQLGGRQVLTSVTADFAPGTITVLTGPTGSGKTSLLESIAGLSQHFHNGSISGRLALGEHDRNAMPPRATAALIGFVPQDVRLSFTAATARDELEYSLRLHGVSRSEIPSQVDTLVDRFGLTLFADRPLEYLSAGQATRVGIASALCGSPRILLLDEPLAELDQSSVIEVCGLLGSLKDEGLTLVIAEHHTAPLEALDPHWLSVEGGVVTSGAWSSPESSFSPRTMSLVGHDEVLQVSHLSVQHDEISVVSDASLTAQVGEIIALTGANGAGKSSLLSALWNIATPATVRVHGRDLALFKSSQRTRQIAHIPEVIADMFVTDTLAEELAYADKVAGLDPKGALSALTFRSLLSLGDEIPQALALTHPRDLSAGTQFALALAIQLSWKPGVVTIDEPSRGFDPHARAAVAEVLRCVAETGTVVLFATHDVDFATGLTSRVLNLRDGQLTEPGKVVPA